MAIIWLYSVELDTRGLTGCYCCPFFSSLNLENPRNNRWSVSFLLVERKKRARFLLFGPNQPRPTIKIQERETERERENGLYERVSVLMAAMYKSSFLRPLKPKRQRRFILAANGRDTHPRRGEGGWGWYAAAAAAIYNEFPSSSSSTVSDVQKYIRIYLYKALLVAMFFFSPRRTTSSSSLVRCNRMQMCASS